MNERIKALLKPALIRAAWTAGQTFVATIGTNAVVLSDVNWPVVFSASILAGIISFVKSLLIGVPEAYRGPEAHHD